MPDEQLPCVLYMATKIQSRIVSPTMLIASSACTLAPTHAAAINSGISLMPWSHSPFFTFHFTKSPSSIESTPEMYHNF